MKAANIVQGEKETGKFYMKAQKYYSQQTSLD